MIIAVGMGAVVYFIDMLFPNEIVYLILEVLIGAIIFAIMSIIVIFIFYKDLWNKFIGIVNKVLRRNNNEKES